MCSLSASGTNCAVDLRNAYPFFASGLKTSWAIAHCSPKHTGVHRWASVNGDSVGATRSS